MGLMRRKKLIIFIDWFEPGFKAGGPIRSIVNFIHHLKNEIDIYVVTGDRDAGDRSPYKDIVINAWNTRDGYSVFYASPRFLTYRSIHRIIQDISPDVIYLNGIFAWAFSILPVLITKNLRRKILIVLAPRGMLKASALQFKRLKKAFSFSCTRGST